MFYFGTNTKQQLDFEGHKDLVEIADDLAVINKDSQLFVLPSMPFLIPMQSICKSPLLWLGTQDVSEELENNTTGEVSAKTLAELKVDLVMVGHAERRALGEKDKTLKNKLKNIAQHKLSVVFCVGEVEKSDVASRKKDLQKQLAILKIFKFPNCLIAYEPVFAIGVNGIPAEPSYVGETFTIIKEILDEMGKSDFVLLYGGSVNFNNAYDLAKLKDCDGLFVGRSGWTKEGFRAVFEKGLSGYRAKTSN